MCFWKALDFTDIDFVATSNVSVRTLLTSFQFFKYEAFRCKYYFTKRVFRGGQGSMQTSKMESFTTH